MTSHSTNIPFLFVRQGCTFTIERATEIQVPSGV